MNKRKKPLRKCVVTNEMLPKEELIRVVRNKEGEVFVDETGKKNGRGAYIKKDREVIEKAKNSGQLKRNLNTSIDESIYNELFKQVGSEHV
ncbi:MULTISPECIES: RNase P modulator RnpM [Allobacillus]|uniref:YlxR family protein n=1 Tax=Allobacillus halotolerans TaxID=570278 RepID=A0ABS6GPM2_9BACI|nr:MULTISPECIES: YlxR family protein [Allobacillus]MBU6081076.1 YlxR family protein [Allobacillus halotolerans]TSJ69187.1 YlxR family protein [Allobacillus sp. SKP2-8]